MTCKKHLPLAAAFAAGVLATLLSGTAVRGCRNARRARPVEIEYRAAESDAPKPAAAPEQKKQEEPKFRTACVRRIETHSRDFGNPEVILYFDRGLDQKSLNEAVKNGLVTVEPAVAKMSVETEWAYWGYAIYVKGSFKYGETYDVKVKGDVEISANDGGLKYKTAAFSDTVETNDPPQEFEVFRDGKNLAPSFGGAIAFRCRNQESVAFSAARVLPQNIPLLLNGRVWSDDFQMNEIADDPVARTYPLHADSPSSVVTNAISIHDFSSSGRVKPGIYIVRAVAECTKYRWEREKYALVQCSDIGVVARESGSNVNVWTVGLTSGKPLSDVSVELYGHNAKLVGSARTDARGVVSFDAGKARAPYYVVAKTDDGDCTLIEMSGGKTLCDLTEHANETFPDDPNELDAFLFSDRGIYRHGDRVFLHGLVRDASGNAPLTSGALPLELRFFSPDGKKAATVTVTVDSIVGHFEIPGGWKIPEDALSGSWNVYVCTPGNGSEVLDAMTFSVEAFVPPQIKVAIDGVADSYACDELPTGAVVKADYLFGAHADGLKTAVSVTASEIPFKSPNHPANDGWRFNNTPKPVWSNIGVCNGITSEDGSFSPDAEELAECCERYFETHEHPAIAKITLAASVTEPNGRKVSGVKTLTKAFVPWFIGVRTGAIRRNAPLPVEIELVKQDGSVAAAENASFEVSLVRIDRHYDYTRRGDGGFTWKENIVKSDVANQTIKVENGKAAVSFSLPDGYEEYELTAVCTSEECNGQYTRFEFNTWGDDDARAAATASPMRLQVKPDKEKYAVGDTASVEIRAPFDGTALVTLQRDKALEQRVVAVSNKTAHLEFAIGTECAPSIEFSATLVRPLVKSNERVVQRALGAASVQVVDPAKKIDLKLGKPVVKILPSGSEVSVALTSSDPHARAVVFLVDEGIINLTDEPVPDPVGEFGRVRWSGTEIYDTYSDLMRIYDLPFAKAEIGGDAMVRNRLRRLAANARRFTPLALEKTKVTFDENGRADVTFRLPEFSGAVRIAAVVWSRRAAGSASANVKIAPDVVSAPDAPRFLAPGDSTEVIDVLHNTTDREIALDWKVEISGAETAAATSGSLKLAPQSSETVRVPVSVPADAVKPVSVKWTVDGRVSAIEIPVRPAVPLRTTVEYIKIPAGGKIEIKPSEGVVPGSERAAVATVKSIYDGFTPAVKYLTGYQWRCTEQCTSCALPFVDSHKALLALGKKLPAFAEARVRASIDAICGRVTDLGIKTWDDCQWIDTFYTAYAGYFLAVAASEGYEVPKDVLDQTAGVLKRLAGSGKMYAGDRALALLALEVLGKPERDTEIRLYDLNGKLDAYSRAVLSLVFRRAGDPKRANAMLAAINPADLKEVREIAWTIRATLASGNDEATDARVTALHSQLLGTIPRWADDRSWCNTTDNAAALLAAGDMIRRFPPQDGAAFEFDFTADSATRAVTNSVPAFALGDGCSIASKSGETRTICVSRVASPLPESVEPVSNGVSIERKFFDRDGNELDPAKDLRANMSIVVALTVKPQGAALKDLVIEEYLPAGIEANGFGKLPDFDWIKRDAHAWVAHKDVRDDAVIVFSGEIDEASVFYYGADVVTAGEFTLPPPQVEHMYLGQIRANGKPAKIKVEK